jgi:hypothetical protein
MGARGALSEFMEDVALATDLDKAVMKIACFNDDSLSKGLFLMFSWWNGRRFVP